MNQPQSFLNPSAPGEAHACSTHLASSSRTIIRRYPHASFQKRRKISSKGFTTVDANSRHQSSRTVDPRLIHNSYSPSWIQDGCMFLIDRPLLETYCLPGSVFPPPIIGPSIPSTSLLTPPEVPALTFSPSSSSDASLPSTPLPAGSSSTRKRKASVAFDDVTISASSTNYLGLELASSLMAETEKVLASRELANAPPVVIGAHRDAGLSIAEFADFLQQVKTHPSQNFNCPLCPNSHEINAISLLRHLYEGNEEGHFHRIIKALSEGEDVTERDLAIATCIGITQEFKLGGRKKVCLVLSEDEEQAQAAFFARVNLFTSDQTLVDDSRSLVMRLKMPLMSVARSRICDRCHKSFGRIYDHKVQNSRDRCTNGVKN